jgi:ABC-2 type transport system ATP-binding protein
MSTPAAAGPALETSGLSKSYPTGALHRGRRPALEELTLSVSRGEVFGYLGPNGAGKTTTLKLLLGLLRADRGSARVLGVPHTERAWRYRAGYLPENPYLYDYLTPQEYLDYAGRLFGMPSAERRERSRQVLQRVGLAESARVPMRRFSKGMLQRAGLAQALLNDPELVFLDEPMSGLDPIGRHMVKEVILDLRSRGRTVFFSTHILSDAESLCDRVALLRDGRLVTVGRLDARSAARAQGPPCARREVGPRGGREIAGPGGGGDPAGRRPRPLRAAHPRVARGLLRPADGSAGHRPSVGDGVKRVLAVAANTYRETVRERVLYNLVLFAVLMTVSGLLMKQLSIRQDERIIKDIGLAAMELFGTLIAVFMGVGLVSKEIERRSLYPLLAKPLGRSEFILGKFAGLGFTLLVNVAVMTAGLYLTLAATHAAFDPNLLKAVYTLFLALLLVVALALLFSALSSSMLAAVGTVILVVAGHFSDIIRNMRQVAPGTPDWLAQALYYALPNFRSFDLKSRVVHFDPVAFSDLGWITLYAAAYVGVVLGLALTVFRSRDLL